MMDNFTPEDIDYTAAFNIVKDTLCQPLYQILKNAGMSPEEVIGEGGIYFDGINHGFDVKNEKYGNMFFLGVIDPLKVTKNALINASSVATTILSTNAIVTHQRIKTD